MGQIAQHDPDSTGMEPHWPTGGLALADESTIGIDEIFEILKNQRRRWVLRYLEAVDGDVRLSDLAEEIAAYENEKDVSQITSQERKRVYVGLYQAHLPKMDDMNIISFNKPRGIIKEGVNIELVREYLPDEVKPPDEAGLRQHLYVASISTLLLAGIGLVEILTVMQLLQPISVVVVGAIALVSLVHVTRSPFGTFRGLWIGEANPGSQNAPSWSKK